MSLFDVLTDLAGGDTARQIGDRIGADPQTTQRAMGAAVPTLVEALSRNAGRSGGAASLSSALDRDHDGSVLDDLGGFLGVGTGGSQEGSKILEHVLGDRRSDVETGIGRASGLDGAQVSQLLTLLAPLVLGALGKEKRSRGLDSGRLAQWLQEQSRDLGRKAPGTMDAVSRMLDRDGDGQVGDDLMELGGKLLGGFLGGRRQE